MARTLRVTVIAVLLAVFTFALVGQAAKGPRISFEKKELVFTNVKEGQTLQAKFKFTNTGDMNLLIDKVSPSCGCTVAEYDQAVAPGASGVINLKIDLTGITGSFRKTAVVSTNDASHPYVTLVVMGETQSRIKVDKGRRIELLGCLGDDISTTVTLTDPENKPLLISGVDNPMKEYLQAKISESVPGKEYKLTLKAIAKEPMRFAGPLFVRVPGASRVSLQVVVDVRGAFVVQPSNLYFGVLRKGGPVFNRAILVRRACTDKLVINKLHYNHDYFQITQSWEKPNDRLLLQVKPLVDKLPPGPFDEKLLIQTGDKAFGVRLKGLSKN